MKGMKIGGPFMDSLKSKEKFMRFSYQYDLMNDI